MKRDARPPDQVPGIDMNRLAREATPSGNVVSAWHRIDQALNRHWDTPLLTVLRYLTGPVDGLNSTASKDAVIDLTSDSDVQLSPLPECA